MKALVIFSFSHLSVSAYAASLAVRSTVSTNGSCGGKNGYTCANSAFGNCCSSSGWCGSLTAYCGAGCQSAFGTCTPSGTTLPVSASGQCGASVGLTCVGSAFGNCCSSYGWCGAATAFCETGCQPAYGTCSVSSSSATSSTTKSSSSSTTLSTSTASASPIPPSGVSTDALCGANNGAICLGSTFGNCCSYAGYCGSTDAYCDVPGCQTAYGDCNPTVTTSTVATVTATASGAATLTPIICPNTAPQCVNNATVLCGVYFGNGIAVATGKGLTYTFAGCIEYCTYETGQLAGMFYAVETQGEGDCACLAAKSNPNPLTTTPHAGYVAFTMDTCVGNY